MDILPFLPEHQDAARRLILDGMAERWGLLDPTKNRDLDDIPASYAAGLFIVALEEGVVVGTGAILPEGDAWRVCRMSVRKSARKRGVGGAILMRLLREAEELGARRIVLETEKAWTDAVRFYENQGFRRVGESGTQVDMEWQP